VLHIPCREGAKVTDRTSSAELDAAAEASRDRKKALTIKARSEQCCHTLLFPLLGVVV